MGYQELLAKIEDKNVSVAVIGMGYVGLPLALTLADAGFKAVVGVDTDKAKINALQEGVCTIRGIEPGLDALFKRVTSEKAAGELWFKSSYNRGYFDIIIVCVDTPTDHTTHQPRYHSLDRALEKLPVQREVPQLIVIESTLAPGTMDNLVRPYLERDGLMDGSDFFLVHAPERVMPGKLLHNLEYMHRTIGGAGYVQQSLGRILYRHITRAPIYTCDCVTAEVVKVAENAYRDVNIAFANELALICEVVGADVWTVRDFVNEAPGRNVLVPGAGVGGHCIPKDPWLLACGFKASQSLGDNGVAKLIPAARAVNDSMPLHMADKVAGALGLLGIDAEDANVAILGMSYLENTDDTRNSPTVALVNRLIDWGINPKVHDPYLPESPCLGAALHQAHVVVLMTNHRDYHQVTLREMYGMTRWPTSMECAFIDGRGAYTQYEAVTAGFVYECIGEG